MRSMHTTTPDGNAATAAIRGSGGEVLRPPEKGAGKDKGKDKDSQEIEDKAAAYAWDCFCGAKGLTCISC